MAKNNKTVQYSASMLKTAVMALQFEIKIKKITSVPKDLLQFFDEVEKMDMKEQKIFYAETLIKLKTSILSFIALHDIKQYSEVNSFIKKLQADTINESKAVLYFSRAFDEVYSILSKYRSRDYEDAKIVFIDEAAKDKLVTIKNTLEELISNYTEKRNLKFNKIVNLFNPENPAISYDVKFITKYQYISKDVSIKKYLPAHYQVMKNKINKEFSELLDTHDFDEVTKKILDDKRRAKLKKMTSEYNYLLSYITEDKDGIDIKILGYEHAPLYPEIKFVEQNDKKTVTKHFHIRSETINALWYKPVQLKSNNTVSEILQHYNHAFGDVYYREKQ